MFDIRLDHDGAVKLIGRFDAAQTKKAEEFLSKLTESTVVNCEELEYISSAGLGVLFAVLKRLKDSGAGLKLVSLNPHIKEVFELAGFDTIFEIE